MTETLAHAMCEHNLVRGFSEVRRFIQQKAITVNGEFAITWDQSVHQGDVIKLGKHRVAIV